MKKRGPLFPPRKETGEKIMGALICFLIALFCKKGRGCGQRPRKRPFFFAKLFSLGLLPAKKKASSGQCPLPRSAFVPRMRATTPEGGGGQCPLPRAALVHLFCFLTPEGGGNDPTVGVGASTTRPNAQRNRHGNNERKRHNRAFPSGEGAERMRGG